MTERESESERRRGKERGRNCESLLRLSFSGKSCGSSIK